MTETARPLSGKIAVVTGASSGIGESTARALVRLGAEVRLAARRQDRIEALCRKLGDVAKGYALDVADEASCRALVDKVLADDGGVDILINSAGLARGAGAVVDDDERDWREMFDANVLGLMRMTQLLLPSLIERGGYIVHLGSVAGLQPYPNGAAYCATKAAVEAFVQALRLELLGTSVRQLVIEPGMVETEFSVVRYHGDADRARAVYDGVVPLYADDVAECIAFALTRPAHVSIQTMLVMPTAQAAARSIARKPRD